MSSRRSRDTSAEWDGGRSYNKYDPLFYQDGEMLPEWNYGSKPSSRRNVWDLPSPSSRRSYSQEPNFDYGGGNHSDYNSQQYALHDRASYAPVAQAPFGPGGQAPYGPGGQAPYGPGGQAPFGAGGQAPFGAGGQAPFGAGGPPPYGAGGPSSSFAPLGRPPPFTSADRFSYSLTEERQPKTRLTCDNCKQEIAKPYKGSYAPWDEARQSGRDGWGYKFITFHDSVTKGEVLRFYSDGLDEPCSWHKGRTVEQTPVSERGSKKSGHGGKKRSGR